MNDTTRTAREVRADLDAIEPLPEDGDVTAVQMIRHFAVRAQERWTRMLTEDGGATEHLRISAMSAEYAVAHVLAALRQTDPAAADSTAKVVADAILHPPGVGEWLWELLGGDTCKQVSKLTEELVEAWPWIGAMSESGAANWQALKDDLARRISADDAAADKEFARDPDSVVGAKRAAEVCANRATLSKMQELEPTS